MCRYVVIQATGVEAYMLIPSQTLKFLCLSILNLFSVQVLKTVEKVLYAADTEEAKAAMIEAQEQYGAQLVVTESEAEGMSMTPAAEAEVEAA